MNTTKTVSLISAFMLILGALYSLQAQQQADKLTAARNSYEKTLAGIESERQTRKNELLAAYLRALTTLTAAVQQEGDLDAIIILNKETTRFKTDRQIPEESITDDLPELQKQQLACCRALADCENSADTRILALTAKYVAFLDSFKIQLTKSGNIDKATDVNSEIETVQSDTRITAAQFRIEEYNAGKMAAETNDAFNEPSQPDTPSQSTKRKYSLENEPKIDVTVKKAKKKSRGGDYDNKVEALSFSVFFRNRELAEFKGLSAVFFAYGKGFGGDPDVVLVRDTFKFDLPRRGEYTADSKSISLEYDDNLAMQFGQKYAGYLVVIYDDEGTIIRSRCSPPRLLKELDDMLEKKEGQRVSIF